MPCAREGKRLEARMWMFECVAVLFGPDLDGTTAPFDCVADQHCACVVPVGEEVRSQAVGYRFSSHPILPFLASHSPACSRK